MKDAKRDLIINISDNNEIQIEFTKVDLELKINWKISRNESSHKTNYICKIIQHDKVFLGEAAPNIRYGETTQKIEAEIAQITQITSLLKLRDFLHHSNISNCLKCALNCSLFDLEETSFKDLKRLKTTKQAKSNKEVSIDKKGFFKTSFSIPIMDTEEVKSYLESNQSFESYKIKIKDIKDLPLIDEVAVHNPKKLLRIDANEGFEDIKDYLQFEKSISKYNIEFIEQPLPSHFLKGYKELKHISKFKLIADESVQADINFQEIAQQFHGVNIKLQKCGGPQRAIELIEEAKKHKLKTMLGCMIETSLGISYALRLAHLVDYIDLDGSLLIKNDPFNFVGLDQGQVYLTSV